MSGSGRYPLGEYAKLLGKTVLFKIETQSPTAKDRVVIVLAQVLFVLVIKTDSKSIAGPIRKRPILKIWNNGERVSKLSTDESRYNSIDHIAQQKHKKAKDKGTLDLYRMAATVNAIHIKAVIKKLYIFISIAKLFVLNIVQAY